VHIPAQCNKSLDIAFSVFDSLYQDNCLSQIILNGDIADFFNLKFHDSLPSDFGIKTRLKDEIWLVNKFLDHIQARYPKVEITFIEGNHEQRLARYLTKKCPDLFDMLDVPSLFKLRERKIKFYPYGRHQLYQIKKTDLYVRHSPYSYSEHCVHQNITKKHINLIHGCTHRYQERKIKTGSGKYLYGCSNGCLINFDDPIFDYMPTDNWVKGFSVVYIDGKWWQNHFVKITDGRTVFGGYEYTGSKDFDFTQ